MYRLVGTDDHEDGSERDQGSRWAVDARGDSRGSEPPDPRARLQSHVARRRAPRERRRQGQLLLPLQEQGRARLRHPRSDDHVVPRTDARTVLLGPRRTGAGADPLLLRSRPGISAGTQLRRWVPAGQHGPGAVRRPRGVPREAGVGVLHVAGAADAGAPPGAERRRSLRRVSARSRRGLSRRLPGGSDSADEADEGHRGHGAVRGGDEAVSVVVRAEDLTVMNTTKTDGDAALVEALRREDPEAPEQLVETFGDRVYRLALRITGSNEDAEEAAQDALWTAARKIGTFKGESAFGSWLYRIAANAAYQKLRARKAKSREIGMDDVLPTLDDDGRHFEPMADWSDRVDEQALQGELRRVLSDAIDGLPADYRTALVLHDVEGLSNPDIAETLGISLPAVKSRVHRSRLFVRKQLADYMKTV